MASRRVLLAKPVVVAAAAGTLLLSTLVAPARIHPVTELGTVWLILVGIATEQPSAPGSCRGVADGSVPSSIDARPVLQDGSQLSVHLEFGGGQAEPVLDIAMPAQAVYYSSRATRSATITMEDGANVNDRRAGSLQFAGFAYQSPWRSLPAYLPHRLSGSLRWACGPS